MVDEDGTSRIGPGRVVLITGASSGIGEAAARAFAAHGCSLVLTARRADRLKAVADAIGPNALAWPMDMKDHAAVDLLPTCLPEPFRSLDVLVNNAGHDVGGRRPFAEGAADDWDDIIDTNLRAAMRVTRAVLPGMIARGRGDIVNMGSISGIKSFANIAAYGASKAAMHMFSNNLRTELAGSGVRVLEIQPGPVMSGFAEARLRGDQAEIERYWSEMSQGAPLRSEDVAEAAVFALTRPAHVTISQLVIMPSSRC